MKARILPIRSLPRESRLYLETVANFNKVYCSPHSQQPAHLSHEPVTARNSDVKDIFLCVHSQGVYQHDVTAPFALECLI